MRGWQNVADFQSILCYFIFNKYNPRWYLTWSFEFVETSKVTHNDCTASTCIQYNLHFCNFRLNNCKRATHGVITGCQAKYLKMEMVFHLVSLTMFIKKCASMFLLSIWYPSTKTMDVIGQSWIKKAKIKKSQMSKSVDIYLRFLICYCSFSRSQTEGIP